MMKQELTKFKEEEETEIEDVGQDADANNKPEKNK
jgi:hypothetical protein